jgi:hypothetical protein
MYLPPNSAANANFLQQLRFLLVQDLDLDDDGQPETLRLAFATPRGWLRDGKEIRVAGAPTAFGEMGFTIRSDLSRGKVVAEITPPPRKPARTLIRFRLPTGWRIKEAPGLLTDGETVDVTGKAAVEAAVMQVTQGEKPRD